MAIQLQHFDLNLLRTLDALLREKSVTRAAEQMFVTQQAMSGSLRRLREHFDDELLVRVGSRLELTALGGALVVPVREVLLQIRLALATKPTFDAGRARRRFRIASSDYACVVLLPFILNRLALEAPGILLDIVPLNASAFSSLESGDVDLITLPSFWRKRQVEPPDVLRFAALYNDKFVCVADASVHIFDEMTLDLYVSLPHTAVSLGVGYRTVIDDAWVRNEVTPKVVATSTSFSSILFMLIGTPLIATVHRRLAYRFAGSLPLKIFPCPIDIDPFHQEMSWHGRSDSDPAHQYLREAFASAGRAMEEPSTG